MKYKVPVSVVMPCYNCGKYVALAIESILAQSYSSFEFIIINDGSTDNTHDEIKRFTDKRIHYIQNKTKQGNYPARNLGMLLAAGKYICIMDGDDIAFPNRLEIQFMYLQAHANIGCIGGLSEIIDKSGMAIGFIDRPFNYADIKTYLLKDNYVTHPTIMFRSRLLKIYNLFYNEEFEYSADYDFMVRLSKVVCIKNLNVLLLKYRRHSAQISSAKLSEQAVFADHIRKAQLKQFGVTYSDQELALHVGLMKGKYFDDAGLKMCEDWLNKLYEANTVKKQYNERHLYDFFEKLLALALHNNSLGEWSIEKELLGHIRSFLPDGKAILEFGSGNGTEALLEFYTVTSIEHDASFSFKRRGNHECVLAPIENNWYQQKCVRKVFRKSYDLFLIDGPPGELRKGILKNLVLFKETAAPVIFDDVNRLLDMEIMMKFCHELNYNYKIINGNKKAFGFCSKIVE